MPQKNKKSQYWFLLAILLGGGIVTSPLVRASSSITSLPDQQSGLQDQLDALTAKIKAYNQIINLKQRQGATLSDQLEGLQAQIDKLQLEINVMTKKIHDLEEQIRVLSVRVAEQDLLIDRQKKMLSELMRVYYTDYSHDQIPVFLTSAETLLYFKTENWTVDISGKMRDLLDSVKALRDSLAQERDDVTKKKQEVDALYKDLDARNASLESARKSKAGLLAQTQSEETKYSNLVDDLQKQQEEIQQEIDSIEASKINELTGLPSGGSGVLSYPVAKFTISQGYGKTTYSTHYKSGMHNGIDFANAVGTPILAAADGKVVGTGNLGLLAYGRWIAIDHGNGLITLYGHLSASSVSKGESVKRGKTIGKMGGKRGASGAGDSTGPHLHFTVYGTNSYEVISYQGKPLPVGASVNPLVYLP